MFELNSHTYTLTYNIDTNFPGHEHSAYLNFIDFFEQNRDYTTANMYKHIILLRETISMYDYKENIKNILTVNVNSYYGSTFLQPNLDTMNKNYDIFTLKRNPSIIDEIQNITNSQNIAALMKTATSYEDFLMIPWATLEKI